MKMAPSRVPRFPVPRLEDISLLFFMIQGAGDFCAIDWVFDSSSVYDDSALDPGPFLPLAPMSHLGLDLIQAPQQVVVAVMIYLPIPKHIMMP